MSVDPEVASFRGLWTDGFFDADPMTHGGESSYSRDNPRLMGVYHRTYLHCIKPYVNSNTVALELGPGRGAWTKCMLAAKKIYAVDAVSAEANKFWEYVGKQPNVEYITVDDFSCTALPPGYFNFMFSFGCLCHISFPNIVKYAMNLYPKLLPGADCFWMIADYAQFERVAGHPLSEQALWPDDKPYPGRWFNAGRERTCAMLQDLGYEIVTEDIGTAQRDPIIHFRKP